jgi:hypothetical protein
MYKIIGADLKEYEASDAGELRQWVNDGRADGRTLVKAEGTNEWKPLASFEGFADVGVAGTPPRLSTPPTATRDAGTLAAQIETQESDLDVMNCLGRGWELLKSNFGLFAAATLLVWTFDLGLMIIPFGNLFLDGVLYGGLYLVILQRMRGQPTSVAAVFSGFSSGFVQLLLTGFLTSLLSFLAGLVLCFLLGIPWVYLKIAWIFALALVADKRLEFWSAMELSRKVANRVWFKLFVLTVVTFAPFILAKIFIFVKTWTLMHSSVSPMISSEFDFSKMIESTKEIAKATAPLNLIAQVVLLFNLPLACCALMYAYEDIFGPRPVRTA